MPVQERSHDADERPSSGPTSSVDTFGAFAVMVMTMFVIATVLAIIGFTSPSWLGFS